MMESDLLEKDIEFAIPELAKPHCKESGEDCTVGMLPLTSESADLIGRIRRYIPRDAPGDILYLTDSNGIFLGVMFQDEWDEFTRVGVMGGGRKRKTRKRKKRCL
jgi:hypothetical protein